MALTRTTEWEGEHVRLVKLGGLPGRGYAKRRSPISLLFVHQSSTRLRAGTDAALAIARSHTSPPTYKLNSDGTILYRTVRGVQRKQWVGGGRGWPGCGHTFVVPGIPQVVDRKIEVYRIHDDDLHTFHTGPYYNRVGVSVCFAGAFSSRHTRPTPRERAAPEPDAMMAGAELILDYLLPRYGIEPAEGLKGHFDAGKPACPGDYLEAWVRTNRGEPAIVNNPAARDPSTIPKPKAQTFDTHEARMTALASLGFDLGDGEMGVWDEGAKEALRAFQSMADINVDGRWGDQTEAATRLALAAQGEGAWPPADS